jgi:hypothetical protein
MIARLFLGLMIALVMGQSGATAQTIESVDTALDLDKCRHTPGKEEEDYGAWRCTGYGGTAVYVTAGDQRSYISFGRNARKERAARQTLAAFNGTGDKIEWRGPMGANGKIKPYAAIVRFSVTVTKYDKTVEGEMIVVFRLPPGGSCQIGFVDAKANPDAEALARKIADENARGFKCSDEAQPVTLGEKGAAFTGPYD